MRKRSERERGGLEDGLGHIARLVTLLNPSIVLLQANLSLKDMFKDKALLERILTHHTIKGPLQLDSLSEQVRMMQPGMEGTMSRYG